MHVAKQSFNGNKCRVVFPADTLLHSLWNYSNIDCEVIMTHSRDEYRV